MKISLIAVLMLFLPIVAAAQQTGDPSADSADENLREVILMAALRPDTKEFDQTWSAYVRKNRAGLDVAATIDRVIKESGDLLRQTNAPGRGSTQRAIPNSKLREKMQALADTAIE